MGVLFLLLPPRPCRGREKINLSPFSPAYCELADDNAERRVRYARFVEQGVPEQELSLMREALQRGQLPGNQRFVDEVEQIIGCRVERRRPGRPTSRPT